MHPTNLMGPYKKDGITENALIIMNMLGAGCLWGIFVALLHPGVDGGPVGSLVRNPASSLIPDVIDTLPPSTLTGEFGGGVAIQMGNFVSPFQANYTPTVLHWPESDQGPHYYTIMMLDMDAPTASAPLYSPLLHWMVGNVPENSWRCGYLLATYSRPRPPPGTGLHRYVFLLYKQPGERLISFTEPVITAAPDLARRNFAYRQFAAKYGLGSPVGVNYFLSEWVERDVEDWMGGRDPVYEESCTPPRSQVIKDWLY